MSSLTINQGTNSAINFDLNGTINTQVIALGYGTLSTIGTLPQISIGTLPTLNITSGSINGTVNIGNTPNIGTIGTLGLGSVVVNSLPNTPGGTLGSILGIGSVSGLSNLPGGTINLVTTVTNLSNGTIQNSGTTTGIGTVSNIGSVTNIGTIPNIPGGTLALVTTVTNLLNGTIQNSGTVTGIGSVSSLGSLAMLNAGTISTLPNIPGGTINILAGGTLGILTNGTISSSGTSTGVGTISNLGSVTNLGQIYNAGTLQGGTIGSILGIGGTENINIAGFNSGLYGAPLPVFDEATSTTGNAVPAQASYMGVSVNGTLNGLTAGQAIMANSVPVAIASDQSLSPIPSINILSTGTAGTLGVGTLVAAPGVGTAIYVCSYSVDGDSSALGTAEAILSFGTAVTGSGVLFRATLNTLNDPSQLAYAHPVNGGLTNTPLTYKIQSGAGSIAWNVTYFVH